MRHVELTDRIGPAHLQRVQDHIAGAAGLTVCLLSPTGQAYTQRSGGVGAFGETGVITPAEFAVALLEEVQAHSAPLVKQCDSTGLTSAAIPLLFHKRLVGCWLVDNLRTAATDLTQAANAAQRQGLDGATARSHLEAMPVFTPSHLKLLLDLFQALSDAVVKQMPLSAHRAEDEFPFAPLLNRCTATIGALDGFWRWSSAGKCVVATNSGHILLCNEVYARYFDSTPDELSGQHYNVLDAFVIEPPQHENGLDALWEVQLPETNQWLSCTAHAAHWFQGQPVTIVTATDTTAQHNALHQRQDLSFQDRVLNIPNTLCMELELRDNPAYDTLLALSVDDLDKISELYGHACGNSTLLALRDYLLGLNITGGSLYSLDIAHFALLLRRDKDHPPGESIAQTIRERCEHPWEVHLGEGLQELYITVNLGVLPLGAGGDAIGHDLYDAIDHVLSEARRAGSVAVFDEAAYTRFQRGHKLERALKQSVLNGMQDLSVYYQPIVDAHRGVWTGLEATCRWSTDEFGTIPSDEFIPLAEATGLINTIGAWVMEQAIQQVMDWNLHELENFRLEVDLSPLQLSTPGLDHYFAKLLDRFGYPPQRLCLEITESSAINFTSHIVDVIFHLARLGVVFALDDFGTGSSSLSILHQFPIKILKINRALIQSMESDPFLQRLLYAMVELAHSSQMEIVVDGVENVVQTHLLCAHGADYFQGLYFAKAHPPEYIERHLNNFTTPIQQLAGIGHASGPLQLSDVSDGNGRNLPQRLSHLLNQCMYLLYASPVDDDSVVQAILGVVGKALDVSRVYFCVKNTEDATFSMAYEWCAETVEPATPRAQAMALHKLCPQRMQTLEQEGLLVAGNLGVLPSGETLPAKEDALATLECALQDYADTVGFVGFDDCRRARDWSAEETHTLRLLTGLVGTAYINLYRSRQLEAENARMKCVLDSLDTMVAVTDLESNRILYANEPFNSLFGRELAGRVCWEALQNRTERCDFCPIPQLLKRPEQRYRWEYFHNEQRKHYRCHNSIIPWTNGKLVHLEQVEVFAPQNKFEASHVNARPVFDGHSVVYNRSSFLDAAKALLDKSHTNGSPVTLVFLKIGELSRKEDIPLESHVDDVVKSLSVNIRVGDLIGRYGADELVIAFAGCRRRNAQDRIDIAIEELFNTALDGGYHSPGFHYGIVEDTEVPYSPTAEYLDKLLNLADLRMLEQKKQGTVTAHNRNEVRWMN